MTIMHLADYHEFILELENNNSTLFSLAYLFVCLFIIVIIFKASKKFTACFINHGKHDRGSFILMLMP